MLHRALFGSIERFTALLIERNNGTFPFWLSPVQVGIIPIKPEHHSYCRDLDRQLKKQGLRTSLCSGEKNINYEIKALKDEKIPYILIAGDKEVAKGNFTLMGYGETNMPSFLTRIEPEQKAGKPEYIM